MTRREWLYFGLAGLLKLGLVALIYFGHGGKQAPGAWLAVWSGDTFSYLDPVENLFRYGTYAQDLARLETYAGRMPGYAVVYGGLRLALAPGAAADGTVVLQVLLSLASLYCLGRLAQAATRRAPAFQWTVLLYAANTFTTVFDVRLLTESFAISALIIGIYAFYLAQQRLSAAWLLAAGGWLAWAIFLRPFLGPVLGLLAAWYWGRAWMPAHNQPQPALRRHVLQGALLLLPFLVADGAWVLRNWPWYHRLVPLQSNTWAGYKNPPALLELNDFMGAIGEEHAWWTAGSDMAWFYKPAAEGAPNFRGQPGKLAPPAYTYDSLVRVRHYLALARDSTQLPATRQAAETKAKRALVAYKRAFQRLRPGRAYGVAPVKLAYGLLLAHPGDYLFRRPFAELPPLQKGLKILVHLWYLLLVVAGMVGTLLAGWRADFAALIVKAIPLYLIGLFCLVVHLVDARYFALGYPFVIIGAVNLALAGLDFLQRKRSGAAY
ncbi:hypothetical protein [Hymenobacter daeguensis]